MADLDTGLSLFLHRSKCTLLGGFIRRGPAHTEPSILSTYIRSITLFHLYSHDIIRRLRKAAPWVLCLSNSWQLWIKQQYIIEFWLRRSLKSFSLVPSLAGETNIPRWKSKLFAVFWGEAGGDEAWSVAFLEMQPQRQDAHRAIVSCRLSIQLTLLSIARAKAQINSIWWPAGDS